MVFKLFLVYEDLYARDTSMSSMNDCEMLS